MEAFAASEQELAQLIREAEEILREKVRNGEGSKKPSPSENALDRFRREYGKRINAAAE